jgi:glucose-1-phosphate thymidylyltransferase
MWGIIPAAGAGTRIQPLAFSKELLPVGSHVEDGVERPRAVSEYLVERMLVGGATRICFVVSPRKSDILAYYGDRACAAHVSYTVQPRPLGLCDALFRALPLIAPDEDVLVGLPDTVWFPVDGFRRLAHGALSFLLFPATHPELFDAVVSDAGGRVREIQVKSATPSTHWVWGGFKLTGAILRELHDLWCERERRDEYVGTLVNAWIARGGCALGVRAGESYFDVGTLRGYREAVRVLGRRADGAGERVAERRHVARRPAGAPGPLA